MQFILKLFKIITIFFKAFKGALVSDVLPILSIVASVIQQAKESKTLNDWLDSVKLDDIITDAIFDSIMMLDPKLGVNDDLAATILNFQKLLEGSSEAARNALLFKYTSNIVRLVIESRKGQKISEREADTMTQLAYTFKKDKLLV